MEGTGGGGPSAVSPVIQWKTDASRLFQYYLDKTTPHPVYRWVGTLVVAAIYVLRVYYVQGFYVVSYGLGIYLLNLLIGFLSPLVDPELETSNEALLPTKGSDEFKPFIRRLPEFKFWGWNSYEVKETVGLSLWKDIRKDLWEGGGSGGQWLVQIRRSFQDWEMEGYSITKAFCVAFVLTFFSAFDVPVFWPILLCYWIVLFILTMKRQIVHMIKYKYVPFSMGKQKYGGKKSFASSSGSNMD
ncbi:Protein RER1B [Vitis vinifera]|uniref:Protein RER1B n=1 Tax=Vitis vinifera TaxID=29760 RepID=A0A438EKI5_VITVI|nr:Protein RER1B [Vitis vinifera]